MSKKKEFTEEHINILSLYHSLVLTSPNRSKKDLMEEVKRRLGIIQKTKVQNIITRYYSQFLDGVEEIRKKSKKITNEGLTEILDFENLNEMQKKYITEKLKGLSDNQAAAKAGYKNPRQAASKLRKNINVQKVIDEQRSLILQTSKYSLTKQVETLLEISRMGREGYVVEELSFGQPVEKLERNLAAANQAENILANILGFNYSDKLKENTVLLKEKEVKIKSESLELEKLELLKQKQGFKGVGIEERKNILAKMRGIKK